MDRPPRFPVRLFVRRFSFLASFAASAALILWMGQNLFALIVQSPWAPLYGLLALGFAILVASLIAQQEVRRDGTLEITSRALLFKGQPLCERAELETAVVAPRKRGGPVVVLRRTSGRPLRLEVSDTERGHDIVRALGLDPRRKPATFFLPTMKEGLRTAVFTLASVVGLASVVATPVLASVEAAVAAVVSLVAYVVFANRARTRLQVDGEGLKIDCLGTHRFVDHEEIESASQMQGATPGVEVTLRSGEVLRLPTATHAEGDGGLASGIVDMLDLVRTSGREEVAREESLLARAGRGAADWLRGMRALAAGANADHRTAPVDPERVWRVLENPAADPSARVGAAAMLAATADEEARTRLRVVARGITAPKVRVAMQAIAEGDDEEAVIEALEAVQERQGPAVRRANKASEAGP